MTVYRPPSRQSAGSCIDPRPNAHDATTFPVLSVPPIPRNLIFE